VTDIQVKEKYFHDTFDAWKKTKGLLYTFQGDYFEGDGSQN
jgi:hypothetical protein